VIEGSVLSPGPTRPLKIKSILPTVWKEYWSAPKEKRSERVEGSATEKDSHYEAPFRRKGAHLTRRGHESGPQSRRALDGKDREEKPLQWEGRWEKAKVCVSAEESRRRGNTRRPSPEKRRREIIP